MGQQLDLWMYNPSCTNNILTFQQGPFANQPKNPHTSNNATTNNNNDNDHHHIFLAPTNKQWHLQHLRWDHSKKMMSSSCRVLSSNCNGTWGAKDANRDIDWGKRRLCNDTHPPVNMQEMELPWQHHLLWLVPTEERMTATIKTTTTMMEQQHCPILGTSTSFFTNLLITHQILNWSHDYYLWCIDVSNTITILF